MDKTEGFCKVCGCTDEQPCVRPLGLESCGWANADHTLCTFCQEKIERGDE